MKKFIFISFVVSILFAASGCANNALLASSTAYYNSTKIYLETVSDSLKEKHPEEAAAIKKNVEEFGKTLEKYNTNKSWYEF